MSTKDSDFKRKVKQATTIQLGASFLKIPQAMHAASFMDVYSKSAAKQMYVRRARDAMQKSMQTNETLAINTVTVLSRCSPATDSSVSTLTRPPSSGVAGASRGGGGYCPSSSGTQKGLLDGWRLDEGRSKQKEN